ncbi:hypothetical protein J2S43_000981 [Catenuloplanes nepalensis]|uniref:Uncharacterized protein n=1 Tax=Catenuloplanes nepalensis TaxID=587533 RepID=A0ABT9MM53_9ACTN|nr:hypothetical protein [Catenuloplanes nepalensis]MDP9792469.1 hypothetical protein [Catenuloplanes nepalensis]
MITVTVRSGDFVDTKRLDVPAPFAGGGREIGGAGLLAWGSVGHRRHLVVRLYHDVG